MDMNVISIIGRAVAIPELRHTQTGKSVATLTLAYKDGTENAEHTSFFDCICWGKTAEFATQYIRKGAKYGIVGSLRQRDWTDKNGNKRRTAEILVQSITFCEPRRSEEAEDYPEPTNEGFDTVPNDEDLPF